MRRVNYDVKHLLLDDNVKFVNSMDHGIYRSQGSVPSRHHSTLTYCGSGCGKIVSVIEIVPKGRNDLQTKRNFWRKARSVQEKVDDEKYFV